MLPALAVACAALAAGGDPLPAGRGPIPLATRNQHPLSLLFLDLPTEAAATLPAGGVEGALRFSYSSIYQEGRGRRTRAILDGELARAVASLRWGALCGLEVGLDLPVQYFTGGFLDRFFRTWHDLLGLPQTVPDDVPYDRFRMEAFRDGRRFFTVEPHDVSLGDLALLAKVRLLREETHPLTLSARAGLEAPTGSRSRGTGSGNWDAGFGLLAQRSLGIWTPFLDVGLMLPGAADGFGGADPRPFLSAAAALRADPVPWGGLVLQLDLNTNVLGGADIPELKRDQLQFLLGADFRLSRRVALEIGFAEDLIQSTSPDWTGFAGVRVGF